MKSTWQTHNGTQYFLADYSNYGRDVDALRVEVDSADEVIEQQQDVLVLVDLRNTVTSSDVVKMMKLSAERTHGHVKKHAIIGVKGIQRILAAAVAKFSGEPLMLFDRVEDARDWLAGIEVKTGVMVRPD
jgi:hypothetical protein